MPPEVALAPPHAKAAIPAAWRAPLLRLALAWIGLFALAWSDWSEMARQWWDASTYNHILLVPLILAWLVRQRWPELSKLAPQAWWPGLLLVAGGALVWLGGTAAGINTASQLGAVVMLQGAVAALLGPRVIAGLLFPLAYMFFLVPFGDEMVPALQAITARLAVALTHASGVPAVIDGVFIDTPVGLFEVAEACSGVKFLVAMGALGTLVAHLCFASWKRRALFMLAALVVPVLANGVRAWGTIYIAQSQGIEFAAGFDHIVYGWIFFALVMALVLGTSWRFFDRSPDDPLIDAAALEASPLLARLAPLPSVA
jgi:exosortase A